MLFTGRSRLMQTGAAIAVFCTSVSAQSNPWSNSSGNAYLSDTTKKVSIGRPNVFVNKLDVKGNMAVGDGYAGITSAPTDGMIIKGQVSIGTTNAPGTNGNLQVNGGVAIGYSASTATPQNGLVVSGAVAIGTTNPPANTALAVNGTIRAKEIIVTAAGWSDFVFKKDYNLKPLNQVERYVKKNNRLEGIPSESEVKRGGIAIGEMQAKLLLKLEEATLYLIELKKENESLKNRLSALEKKVR